GYIKCMRMKNCPISKENVQHLFINIEKIFEFNREFLKQLENTDEDPVEMADCFVKNETGFQTYTEYCTNYPKSVEVLTECTRQKEPAMFIQEIQMNLGHSLPLGSYLLKPVQRILKYHLLLREMKKRFDKENDAEGFEIICDALFAMTDVARYINEMKRQHEATLHVQEIQSQLSEFEGPDLTTYGDLVIEDTFRVVGTRTDRYLILFEKILLITKKRERENGYTCKASVLLSNMMMTESLPKDPLAFQIIRFDNQKVAYPFMARSMDQKNKWTLALKKLLVESLVAEVPLKAKALILGEGNVDEDDNSETESGRKSHSPSITRRQNVKGRALYNMPYSGTGSLVRGVVCLGVVESKRQDENNNPQDELLSSNDAVFVTLEEEENDDNIGEELTSIIRLRTYSLDRDLPHPKQTDNNKESRIKSMGATVDVPWIPKRTSSSKFVEGRLSVDKCISVSDLRSSSEDNTGLAEADSDMDITKELCDITENSKIHKTVREVAMAFSFSEPYSPSENPVLSIQEKDGRALDELLESIDRELDETRRTINSAQLLESAIKLKQINPLSVMWPPQKSVEENEPTTDIVDSSKTAEHHVEPKTAAQQSNRSSGSSSTQDVCQGEEEDRDIKAELAAFEKQSPQFSKLITDKHRTCSLDRRRGKKVFELPRSPRTNRFSTGDINDEQKQQRSVHDMARRYSKHVRDEKAWDFRSRFHSDSSASPVEARSPIKVDSLLQLKVERVTKVKFDSNLESSLVIRRRRKSGSRHKRSSWSHEDAVRVDVDLLRLKIERPRSLHEIKPPKELIDLENNYEYEYADGLDEGLAPALLAGMQKDDVVVRGLVKHLVHKFGTDQDTGGIYTLLV
ncbi:hypothetical protein QZH41_014393, partial [Actinostola sp. cb2023]